MSTPESGLSPQERAAFADLEAAARAHDPHLAARLSSAGAKLRFRAFPPRLVAYAIGRWRLALQHAMLGLPVAAFGFFLMALGIRSGLGFGLAGAVIAVVGLRLLVGRLGERMASRRALRHPD